MNRKAYAQIRTLFVVVSAVFALCTPFAGHAQAQRVSLTLTEVPLSQAMSEIERQTSYRFVPNIEIDIQTPVSVRATDEALGTVLDRLLEKTPYTYSLLESTTTILLSKRSEGGPRSVSGTVRDEKGLPIIGAAVIVKGTTIGTSTGVDGGYTLQIPPPRLMLF